MTSLFWKSYGRTLFSLVKPLQCRHNERDGVSNHRCIDCLVNRLVKRRSNKTSKLRVIGLCEGNSPVTGEFSAQRTSNAEKVSIGWRHHVMVIFQFEYSVSGICMRLYVICFALLVPNPSTILYTKLIIHGPACIHSWFKSPPICSIFFNENSGWIWA